MPARERNARIVSWNVNGLRACARKGFTSWLARSRAEVVGVQEVRALPEQLEPELREPRRWHTHFSPAERKGYSGVGLFSRRAPDRVEVSLGESRFDEAIRALTSIPCSRIFRASLYSLAALSSLPI